VNIRAQFNWNEKAGSIVQSSWEILLHDLKIRAPAQAGGLAQFLAPHVARFANNRAQDFPVRVSVPFPRDDFSTQGLEALGRLFNEVRNQVRTELQHMNPASEENLRKLRTRAWAGLEQLLKNK
jgi:hypothetical protein